MESRNLIRRNLKLIKSNNLSNTSKNIQLRSRATNLDTNIYQWEPALGSHLFVFFFYGLTFCVGVIAKWLQIFICSHIRVAKYGFLLYTV